MKIVGEEKPVVRPVVRKVFTAVSLAWSGVTLIAWISLILVWVVWPQSRFRPNLLRDISTFISIFGSFGSVPMAIPAVVMNSSKHLKIILGLAAATTWILFLIVIAASLRSAM